MGERKFGRNMARRRVCFACKRTYAGRQKTLRSLPGFNKWRTTRPCSECGGPTVAISHATKVPRRHDKHGWSTFADAWASKH